MIITLFLNLCNTLYRYLVLINELFWCIYVIIGFLNRYLCNYSVYKRVLGNAESIVMPTHNIFRVHVLGMYDEKIKRDTCPESLIFLT